MRCSALTACAAGLAVLLGSCTTSSTPDVTLSEPTSGRGDGPVQLPDTCDALLSTPEVAQAMGRQLFGDRSYSYLGSNAGTGRRAGLVCEYRADGSEGVTITARQFETQARARASFVQLVSLAGGRMLGRPTRSVVTAESISLHVLDAQRTMTIVVDGSSTGAPVEAAAGLARVVLRGLD